MFIYGREPMGVVDRVPGVCHVHTLFFHIWFVPLVPLATEFCYRVGRLRDARRIQLSYRSVLITWFRTACTLVTLGLAVWTIALAARGGEAPQLIGLTVFAISAAGLGLFSLKWKYIASVPPWERVEQLSRFAHLDPPTTELLRQHYEEYPTLEEEELPADNRIRRSSRRSGDEERR